MRPQCLLPLVRSPLFYGLAALVAGELAWSTMALAATSAIAPKRSLCAALEAPAMGADATKLVQQAIDACAKAGGGRVTLRPGHFVINPIHLQNNVDLHLDSRAVLEATVDHQKFKSAYINWPYQPDEALISVVDVENAAITGEGTIDGRGDTWWAEASEDRKAGNPKTIAAGMPASNGLPRPWLVEAYHARNFRVAGVKLIRSPMWTLALRYSDHVTVTGIDIRNPEDAPNTDGIDVVATRNVAITDSVISTGDDDIALKSGLPGTKLPAEATEHIRIDGLKIGKGHGLSIGSETLFGIRDVVVRHVLFNGTDNGIRIKTGRDRGNRLENLRFVHVRMRNVGTAVSISAYYPKPPQDDDQSQPVTATTPFINDVVFSDLTVRNSKQAGVIAGLPESPVKNLWFKNVDIEATSGFDIRHAHMNVSDMHVTGGREALKMGPGTKLEGNVENSEH